MSDNRTTELLPCPFCGGEAKLSHYETFDNDEWAVECMGVCEIQPATCLFFTKEQAIEAWNTRTPEQAIAATLGSGTCRNVHKEWEKSSFAGACTSFCCSECGAHYVDCECYYAGLADADEEQIRTNYCPNCGAKVIGG